MVLNATINQTVNASLHTDLGSITSTIKPLLILILGIAIYSFFIYKFYRFLAERDILKLHWHKKYGTEGVMQKFAKVFFYLLENVILIPVIVFFWFIILAALLLLLSNNDAGPIMLISMAIIGAIRITSYYTEDLSRDLAKMIPFTFLGVFIINLDYSSFATIGAKALAFIDMGSAFVFYLLFVAALELVMRIIRLFSKAIKGEDGVPTEEEAS